MTAAAVPAQAGRQLGHNRISTQALTSTAQAAAAEALSVPPASVRVTLSDDAGALAISLATPLGLPRLEQVLQDRSVVARSGGDAWHRAHQAKAHVFDRVTELTGSMVSRVDLRITGVRVHEGSRVH